MAVSMFMRLLPAYRGLLRSSGRSSSAMKEWCDDDADVPAGKGSLPGGMWRMTDRAGKYAVGHKKTARTFRFQAVSLQ